MICILSVLVADHGSVVVFSGTDTDDLPIVVAVDHRMAQDLIEGIAEEGEAVAFVEPWQIIGRGVAAVTS